MRLIFKKVLAVLFMLLGLLFALFSVIQIPSTISTFRGFTKSPDAYTFGYFIGAIIILTLTALIAYVFLKFGLKWLKEREVKGDDIDAIGMN